MRNWLLVLTLLLAACGGEAATTNTPVANVGVVRDAPLSDQDRNPPTQPPPEWHESVAPITLDNAPQLSYLGRLDVNSPPSTVFDYAISTDNTQMAGLNNDLLVVWDLIDGHELFTQERGGASRVLFSPDKTAVFLLDNSGLTSVIDATNGTILDSFASHPTFNNTVAYDEDQGWLAIGGTDGDVKVWDTFERVSMVTFSAHGTEEVGKINFSHDSARLVSGARGAVHVWNWRDRQQVATFDLGQDIPQHVIFSPDDTQVAVATRNTLYILAADDLTLVHSITLRTGEASDLLKYSPDGRLIITGGIPTDITIWNPQTGSLITRLPGIGERRVSAAFSPDGNMLLTSSLTGPVSLWNISTLGTSDIARADLDIEGQQYFVVDWTADSRLLTILDALGPIYIWGIGDAG